LSYLDQDQIIILLDQLRKSTNVHVALVAKVCLATGARWGESEGLRATQVRNGMIQFVQTKSSKARAVPITDELEKSLKLHHKDAGDGERIFTTAYAAFRQALHQANLNL
jgi:integrase